MVIAETRRVQKCGPYLVGKELGRGASAVVCRGHHEDSGDLVALKMISLEEVQNDAGLERRTYREIAILRLLDHPNVLKLFDVVHTEEHVVLVLEYMDYGDLLYLLEKGRLDEAAARNYFAQLLAGVRHCHERHVYHRDLKLENLLLNRKGRLVVADFDLASSIGPTTLFSNSCGSPNYVAPEVLSGRLYNGHKADIWSCGVTLYGLVTGSLPFDDESIPRIMRKVRVGKLYIPMWLSDPCASIIRRTLVVQPERRIALSELLQDPWVAGGVQHRFSQTDSPWHLMKEMTKVPVLEPDGQFVQCLTDMGWGSQEQISDDLQLDEETVVRELYYTLCLNPKESSARSRAKFDNQPNPLEAIIHLFMSLIPGAGSNDDDHAAQPISRESLGTVQ